MPSRNLSLRSNDYCLEQTGLEQLNTNSLLELPTAKYAENVFSIGMNEWDDWIRWDRATDVLNSSPSSKSSAQSTGMDSQQWRAGLVREPNYLNFDEMFVEDVLYESDEPNVLLSTKPESFQAAQSRSSGSLSRNQPRNNQYIPDRSYSLSIAEEDDLQDTAMSYELISSETLGSQKEDPAFLPEDEKAVPSRVRNKRRRSSRDEKPEGADLYQSRKQGHNAIEKRYRKNLNEKIIDLRQAIPSLRISEGSERPEDGLGDNDNSPDNAQKHGKAAILTTAVEYIMYLEQSSKQLGSEVTAFKSKISALEKLAMLGSRTVSNPPCL